MSLVRNARRDAAEHQTPKAATLVRAEDDDIGPFGFRGGQDRFRGLALPDQEGGTDTGRPGAQDERLRLRLDLGSLLVDAAHEETTRQAEPDGIDHAEHDQLGTLLDRQCDRPLGGVVGDGRQVGREEEPPDRSGAAVRRCAGRHALVTVTLVRRRPGRVHAGIIREAASPGTVTSGTLRRADQPEPRSGSYYRFVVLEPNVAPAFSTGPVHTALDIAVRGVAGLLSVDEVLQVIVDQVRPVVGARYAALGIVDPVGHIEKFITSGIDEATRERIGPLPEGRGLLGLIIRENRSFRIADIAADPHSSGFPPNHPPMTSFLGVPITVKGKSLGRLYLTDKIGAPRFSAEDQALVETFAVHAGIAMENARLHEQLNRLAIVDERDRISKDLHDGIIQNLYGVSLSLEDIPELMTDDPQEAADRLERAIDAIHFAIQDIRNFIFGLRPELLAGRSLVGGLASLVEEYRHNTIIDLELRVPAEFAQPPDEVTGQLLAIAGESSATSCATRRPAGHPSS